MTNNRWRLVGINLITTVGVLLLVEILARLGLHQIYNRNFDSKLIVEHKYFESAGLAENGSGIVWGKPFHTDSLGCRKPTKAYDTRKKKWLFIGDSVTEGVGVDDSAVFSSLVFQAVDSLNILNYSLIGYSDADYLNVLRVLVTPYDTSIAGVTIFFCLNDVYGNSKTGDLPVMARQNILGKVNTFFQNDYATYKLVKLFLYQHSDRYFKYDLQFYSATNSHFTEAMNILRECDLLSMAAGVRLNVIMLPYSSQLTGENSANRVPQHLVSDFCKLNNINFFDPRDYLVRMPNPGSLYLFGDEIHFSVAGHRAMANYILSQ